MWSFYMSILILGFIPGVYMVTCPQKGDIYPCTCEDRGGWMITVTCSRGSFITSYSLKILQQALSSLNGKNDIDFRFKHSNISIPSNFFAGIGIKDLEFYSCRINSLGNDDQMLTGLENHLEMLRITDCSLVPPELNLGHLKKLRNIHWSRSNITELTDDWLTYSYSLEYLSIARSNITKIGSYAFYHLMNLYSLKLEDNHFGPIQRTMFPRRANKLTRLDLEVPQLKSKNGTIIRSLLCSYVTALLLRNYGTRNNALTDLPVDLFSGMPSIEQVYLQRNRITTLGKRTWSPIWQQLDKLWLQDNNIICDDRLKWISKSKENPQDIFGQCSAPEELKGMDLEAFFRSQKQ